MYAKREMPTLDSVLKAVNEDDDLENLSKTTLWRLMKDIGFTFGKRKRNLALIERGDIIAWRRRCLRAIKEFRKQGRSIINLDETWVNAGHTKECVWQDKTLKSSHDAFLKGLTTGLPAPSGKGARLILVRAGSSATEQVEAEVWERDMIVDDEIEPIVFSICDSCNSSSDESSADFSDDYLSGIKELV
ncbi:hypothetical protein HPB50_027786 [Hyalomma asiaticum]|nr:hypothetical protein HPB50_027786 [Hyalomma asiaticum]